jgi:four helix bundle protein
MGVIKNFKDLDVYRNAMAAAMRVFELSRTFPVEERYSLTDQIRRSSRSVCANLAEAWRKRRYQAAFISKLSDAEAEAAETQAWTEIALRCGYWNQKTFSEIDNAYDRVLAQLTRMSMEPQKWLLKSQRETEIQ